MRVEGSAALVTGANRGLGLEIVGALLRAGADVVHVGARNPDRLAHAIALDPVRVRPLRLDVTRPMDVERATREAAGTSLLIHNAGILDLAGPPENGSGIRLT